MAKSFNDLVRRTTTKAVQERAVRRSRELLGEMLLKELRKLAKMSQRELAAALGIRQPTLSRLESQDDMQISTLKRIVEALGGELQVIVSFPRGTIRVTQFDARRRSRKNRAVS